MAKSYKGHSFFVTQRRNSASPNIPCSSPEKRQPYMMEQRHGSSGRSRTTRVTSSRKNSRTESVNSEVIRSALPEDLKKQLDALEKINRFDSGKMFCLSDGNSTATSWSFWGFVNYFGCATCIKIWRLLIGMNQPDN